MSEVAPKKMGRPTIYSIELADLVCERIATSKIGTATLAKLYDDMPSEDVIYKWRYYDHDNFNNKYTKAKAAQAQLMADELEDLCREVPTHIDEHGVERIDAGMMARQRLLVDTRKWYASKLAPKVFGRRDAEEDNSDTEETVKTTRRRLDKALDSRKKDY